MELDFLITSDCVLGSDIELDFLITSDCVKCSESCNETRSSKSDFHKACLG